MTTYTLRNGKEVIGAGLTLAEVGAAIVRAGQNEWHVRRNHDGTWTLWMRLHDGEELSDWIETKIIVEGENEEQANTNACEAIAQSNRPGFSIIPEGEN